MNNIHFLDICTLANLYEYSQYFRYSFWSASLPRSVVQCYPSRWLHSSLGLLSSVYILLLSRIDYLQHCLASYHARLPLGCRIADREYSRRAEALLARESARSAFSPFLVLICTYTISIGARRFPGPPVVEFFFVDVQLSRWLDSRVTEPSTLT